VNRVLYRHSGQYSTCGMVVQGRRMSALLAATKVGKSPVAIVTHASQCTIVPRRAC
jgi:hypothetical protein